METNISRHGSGFLANVRALASQIHPVFMLPPLAASVFGGLLYSDSLSPLPAFLHASSVFFGLYTAHVKDGYIDFYVRDEDDDHPLTESGCKIALAGATFGFFVFAFSIALFVDLYAFILTVPGWIIGYLHAPQFDMNPVTATSAYPAGIGLSVLGGYYVQATAISPEVLGFAGVFFVILSGVKIIDDSKDYEYDRSISKRTVAVVTGPSTARKVALATMGVGLVATLALVGAGVFPENAVLGVIVFAGVVWVANGSRPELATMILIRGSYVFLALLFVAVLFETGIDAVQTSLVVGFLGVIGASRLGRRLKKFEITEEKRTKVVIRSAYLFIALLLGVSWLSSRGGI